MKKLIFGVCILLLAQATSYGDDSGLQVAIELDKHVEAQVYIKESLKNFSGKTVSIKEAYHPPKLTIYIEDSEGKKTEEMVIDRLARTLPDEMKSGRVLIFGEIVINLPKGHDHGQQNIYFVDGGIKSNTITVDLDDKK
jgi:hypothetical protein